MSLRALGRQATDATNLFDSEYIGAFSMRYALEDHSGPSAPEHARCGTGANRACVAS